jgi:hypothetical protein
VLKTCITIHTYDHGLIIFTKTLNLVISFYMESSVMSLIQRKTILKYFENHKLKYIMKYGF